MINPAAKQYFRCANAPNSDISKLIDFTCPLYKKKKFPGNFRESGFKIDISGIALCTDCYSRKQRKYFEEIDKVNIKYGITVYSEQYNNCRYECQIPSQTEYSLHHSEIDEECHKIPACKSKLQGKTAYKSILTSDQTDSSFETSSDSIELSAKIAKPVLHNLKRPIKRSSMLKK